MRPFKEGLDYFELDCHMDEKVRLIQAEFGLKGFAVVVLLYQEIYGGRGYYMTWDDDRSLLFMSEHGVTGGEKNLIKEIVEACIRRDIFSEDLFQKYQILTSSGIQKRYLKAVARREKVELEKEYLLINVPENAVIVCNNSENVCNNSENVDRNSQSREEKRKEEKSREKKSREPKADKPLGVFYPNDEKLDEAFKAFVDYRKKTKHPMTDRAITLAMKEIEKLATDQSGTMNNDLAIKIIDQSIFRGWQGLFPLKEDRPQQSGSGPIDWANL